jgi:phospholipid/cholesterol/gamma-HCH transport system substrate-binding protein
MRQLRLELGVGAVLLLGIASLAWIAIDLGDLRLSRGDQRTVFARFDSVQGLPVGAAVEIAGVRVGRVERIALEKYRAVLTLSVERSIPLQDDAIVSVRSKGIIGESFVRITPGASTTLVADGGTLRETEDPVDIEQLIATYVHGKI